MYNQLYCMHMQYKLQNQQMASVKLTKGHALMGHLCGKKIQTRPIGSKGAGFYY